MSGPPLWQLVAGGKQRWAGNLSPGAAAAGRGRATESSHACSGLHAPLPAGLPLPQVTYNPFNVYISQPQVKGGCVLRRANVGLLEREQVGSGAERRAGGPGAPGAGRQPSVHHLLVGLCLNHFQNANESHEGSGGRQQLQA